MNHPPIFSFLFLEGKNESRQKARIISFAGEIPAFAPERRCPFPSAPDSGLPRCADLHQPAGAGYALLDFQRQNSRSASIHTPGRIVHSRQTSDCPFSKMSPSRVTTQRNADFERHARNIAALDRTLLTGM
jgi:hypothetical protein